MSVLSNQVVGPDCSEKPPRALAEEVECWPPYHWPAQPIRATIPPRGEFIKLRVLIVLATASLIALLVWLLNPQRVGDSAVYFGLTGALLLRAICWIFEWYNYFFISIPRRLIPRRKWSVDILTTACPGEPQGMIVRTLKAMVAVRYPHTNYLCDEGNDPVLKRVCEELGVVHVTRTEKKNAKAGNINNALKQATGDIAVVLDPDHEPSPYLLDRTLGYFEDPTVGFVQSVQAYRNQGDSVVARGAAEQSYHFYGPYMMGMHGCGTTQAIGANCVFRRTALDSISGHAPGLAEDMHTSMRLYSKGWHSVYVPEIFTRGLVPSTLAAFYKQQIKWACGVFDLLFLEYPKLFNRFTFRQKLHYLICPVFFLRGLITLLEMLVPIASLILGVVAWRATVTQLVLWFAPMLILATLVRLRVQRWLMEPHERGMHIAGGSLAIATWWVYLAGVFCAVFRIKVPYIPTPKEDEPSNAVKIALPNFIAAGVLILAAVVGVSLDSSPPALVMAGLATLNAVSLLYISITAQQVMLLNVRRRLERLKILLQIAKNTKRAAGLAYRASLRQFREGRLLPIGIALATVGIYFINLVPSQGNGVENPFDDTLVPDTGGFYTGIHLSAPSDQWMDGLTNLQSQFNFQFRVVSLDLGWGSSSPFPTETLKQLRRAGAVPMLNWLPAADSPFARLRHDQAVLKQIGDGKYDDYIRKFAISAKQFGEPVLICFAPQPDNPDMPWSSRAGNTPADFIAAWQHLVMLFQQEAAANVGWVWSPANAQTAATYFPQEAGYIDWIALPISQDPTSRGTSFARKYDEFHSHIAGWHRPIMITGLDSSADEYGTEWVRQALSDISVRYPEIKSVVLDDTNAATESDDDSQWLTVTRQTLNLQPFNGGHAQPLADSQPLWFDLHPQHESSPCVTGRPGHFSLIVDGKPFYIKGVAYNPGQDWRDANVPLSSAQLNHDFAIIHNLGGNVVRRYGRTWSDRNIFNAAASHQLKVMYGFWFMQDENYLTDAAKQREYESQIESTVRAYRNHPGLLGWCLGNEVWGLLKHKYSQPYLTDVRHSYVLFVERMAKRIRQLDPNHPIFSAQEAELVSGAISDYAVGAPSVDVMAVNAYYQPDISNLQNLFTRFDPSRPYLVSEFGPDGYWNNDRNHYDSQKGLLESTAETKAWYYADRWREDIHAHAGQNVGGVAYCWSDRYEGTATWFGMVDLQGRTKPVCDALRAAWHNPDPRLLGQFKTSGPVILDVDYPTDPQWPGEPFIVKANVQYSPSQHPQYLWSVSGPNFKTDVGHITPLQNGQMAAIELPDEPGWYRVQLKVVAAGGVDEANVPVFLHDSESGDPQVVTFNAFSRQFHQ